MQRMIVLAVIVGLATIAVTTTVLVRHGAAVETIGAEQLDTCD